MSEALLEVQGLSVEIPVREGLLRPVRGVSFHVDRGETLAIVGESGCGKSLTSLAVMGLLPRGARRQASRLALAGRSLLDLPERRMADLRGDRVAMIFQEPMTALNPAYTIGNQLVEVFRRHRGGGGAARERALELLSRVGIPAPERRLGQYPHQLSGGLRQRAMIAMALMCEPDLLIADEPTTALDVTIQAQILRLLADLKREFAMGLVLITHDLGVVARVAERVAVMYGGQIVEEGSSADLFRLPLHPYTEGLLRAIPASRRVRPGERLGSIPGVVAAPFGDLGACVFVDRCPYAHATCRAGAIDLRWVGPERAYRCVLPADGSGRSEERWAALAEEAPRR